MPSSAVIIRRVWPPLKTVLAVVVVHLSLGLYYVGPRQGGVSAATPTWELLVLVPALVMLGLLVPSRRARLCVAGMGAPLLTAATLLGVAQTVTRRYFGTDVALAIDLRYVPVLVRMMQRVDSTARFVTTWAVVIVALVLLLWVSAWAIVHLCGLGDDRRRLPVQAAIFVVGMGAAAAACGINGPLGGVVADQIHLAVHKDAILDREARELELEARDARARFEPAAVGDERPSLWVFVVESYGTTSLDHDPGFRQFLAGEMAGLVQAGYTAASTTLTSPVFGGHSWMAHAAMLCGVMIQSQRRFDALRVSTLTCLPDDLGRAGYETVAAGSNTGDVDADYLRLYPYAQRYFEEDLGYQGPPFGWSNMPDQFVIERVDRRERARRGATTGPDFRFYMLTSSHFAWGKVPVYLPDWSQIGDGRIFHERPGPVFPGNTFEHGDHYDEGYDLSVRYSLHTVFGYLRGLPETERPLVIVLGDHPPLIPRLDKARDPWTVMVHVLGRDPTQVARFVDQGYQPGIEPNRSPAPLPLARLRAQILTALGPR